MKSRGQRAQRERVGFVKLFPAVTRVQFQQFAKNVSCEINKICVIRNFDSSKNVTGTDMPSTRNEISLSKNVQHPKPE